MALITIFSLMTEFIFEWRLHGCWTACWLVSRWAPILLLIYAYHICSLMRSPLIYLFTQQIFLLDTAWDVENLAAKKPNFLLVESITEVARQHWTVKVTKKWRRVKNIVRHMQDLLRKFTKTSYLFEWLETISYEKIWWKICFRPQLTVKYLKVLSNLRSTSQFGEWLN